MTPRVRRGLDHLLDGALAALRHAAETPEARLVTLRARFAKLPEAYQAFVLNLAGEFERGRWA